MTEHVEVLRFCTTIPAGKHHHGYGWQLRCYTDRSGDAVNHAPARSGAMPTPDVGLLEKTSCSRRAIHRARWLVVTRTR